MNLNNKNTPCIKNCTKPSNCPGLMADGNFVTNWKPRKDNNKDLMIKFNEYDEHKLRSILIKSGSNKLYEASEGNNHKTCEPSSINGSNYISEITDYYENLNKYRCNITNMIDSDNINKYFDNNMMNIIKTPNNEIGSYSKMKIDNYSSII